uniref:Uncharacterized protein n=1 Tax=Arundo donax TaxID=35708 RepID=A0A0A9HYE9_ARUDO
MGYYPLLLQQSIYRGVNGNKLSSPRSWPTRIEHVLNFCVLRHGGNLCRYATSTELNVTSNDIPTKLSGARLHNSAAFPTEILFCCK